MKSFEKPMIWLGFIFMLVMAVLGWYTCARTQWDPAAIVICVLATGFLIFGMIGWWREALIWVAGGVIGCSVLFPTQWGLPPMIVGFVMFALMVGLKMFIMIDEAGPGGGSSLRSTGDSRAARRDSKKGQ